MSYDRHITHNLYKKRMYARLFGLNLKNNWKAECRSMPARINDKWYDGPLYCDDKVSGGRGACLVSRFVDG